MNLKKINEAFSKFAEQEKVELKEDATKLGELRDILRRTFLDLKAKNASRIGEYEVAYQDAIEKVFPDHEWWEVTDCDIYSDLLENKDPVKTIINIIEQIKPEFKETLEDKVVDDISVDDLEEDFEEETKKEIFHNSNGDDYEVIERSKSGENALLKRGNMWIVAWNCPKNNRGSWGQGHYFPNDEENARKVWEDDYKNESLKEDTVKTKSGKWVNKGDTGETHGTFKTKKEADAQRKAMFAKGYKTESKKLTESDTNDGKIRYVVSDIDYSIEPIDVADIARNVFGIGEDDSLEDFGIFQNDFDEKCEEIIEDILEDLPREMEIEIDADTDPNLVIDELAEKISDEAGGWNVNSFVHEKVDVDEGLAKSERHNRSMKKIFDTKKLFDKKFADFLRDKGYSEDQIEELRKQDKLSAEIASKFTPDGHQPSFILGKILNGTINESVTMNEAKEDYEFKAFVTNLGKYNGGELVGEWVSFPIDEDDFAEVLKRIKISDQPDENGEVFEEWFVTDYECGLPGFEWEQLGEYPSYNKLNEFGELVEEVSNSYYADEIGDVYEVTGDLQEAIDGLESGDIYFISGIYNDEDLGQYLIQEIYGDDIPQDLVDEYFDYSSFGRDVRLEYYPVEEGDPETAGEYWCGDENASDREIGEEVIDQLGFESVSPEYRDYYFDYESFGQAASFDGYTFTKNGVVYDGR